MNLGDPELELIDPTPNIHLLFVNFDKLFFCTKLANRAVVRWSKRMYSCAGVCSYEGPLGLCDIALSEPLLKLRPRKDLIETLLHEMIHAYLFITNNDKDRDGHGPNFQAHMHRINQYAGLKISIYHSFHEEVELYQTHWWRCNGPCQKWKPYFGINRRSMNKAPGPTDSWWNYHQKKCGGTFIKIKEPEKPVKKSSKAKKPNADITKYITNNNNPKINVLKDCNNITNKSNEGIKSNSQSTVIMTKKGNVSFNPKVSKPINPPVMFSGNGHVLSSNRNRSNSLGAAETVRNVWANKQLPSTSSKEIMRVDGRVVSGKNSNPNKHKADAGYLNSPPTKIKKIDDYFKTNASAILKDVYGGDFKITQSANNKFKAVCTEVSNRLNAILDCPVCSLKVNSNDINRHLDECLNKDVIAQMSKDSNEKIEIGTKELFHNKEEAQNELNRLENELKSKDVSKKVSVDSIDLTFHSKEQTENEFNRTENELKSKDISKKGFDDSIDLTGSIVLPPRYVNCVTEIKNIMFDNYFKTTSQNNSRLFNHQRLDIKYHDAFIGSMLDMEEVKPTIKNMNHENNSKESDNLDILRIGVPNIIKETKTELLNNIKIKIESEESKDTIDLICPCCGKKVQKPVAEHLDVCIGFFNNNTTVPGEGTSNVGEEPIVIEDDDIFDETQTLNATGTKSPCPCCLEMIEEAIMNMHLDTCLK